MRHHFSGIRLAVGRRSLSFLTQPWSLVAVGRRESGRSSSHKQFSIRSQALRLFESLLNISTQCVIHFTTSTNSLWKSVPKITRGAFSTNKKSGTHVTQQELHRCDCPHTEGHNRGRRSEKCVTYPSNKAAWRFPMLQPAAPQQGHSLPPWELEGCDLSDCDQQA